MLKGQVRILRIYLGEGDIYEGKSLYQEIVGLCKKRNIAGATVLRGIYGYGGDREIRSSKILSLSDNLPIVIEVLDTKENILSVLPEIRGMMKDTGLMTVERAQVVSGEEFE